MADPEDPEVPEVPEEPEAPPVDPLYIRQHEDAIVDALAALGVFAMVSPADKKIGLSTRPQYPAAFVSYVDDALLQDQPRPIYNRFFQIYVLVRDLRSEEGAKDASIEVLGAVDDCLSGNQLSFSNIGPLVRTRTVHNGYDDGVLGYIMQYRCRFYRELP